MKGLDIQRKQSKLRSQKMNKKLKATLKVLENVNQKYPDT